MRKKPKFQIDKKWFDEQLNRRGKSMRAMARHLDVDASSMSRMLAGMRAMKMSEASDIAAFLGTPVEDVLAHAGVPMSQLKENAIKIVAEIDEKGNVKELKEPRILPASVSKPFAGPLVNDNNYVAAAVTARKGVMSLWDDTVVLYNPGNTDLDASGSLCVVKTHDGKSMLAHVVQIRKTLEATLRVASGDVIETRLASACPVLVIIP